MMSEGISGDLYYASTWILPLLFAVTLHEAAHAYVAYLRGDSTAKSLGRVSMNPLVHIDRFGTVILPLLLLLIRSPFIFGWAKPVPVDSRNLIHPRRDMVWVALAGPVTNILLAMIAALLVHLVFLRAESGLSIWIFMNLYHAVLINIILAVFNMFPVPPLDGGRIAVGLLPRVLAVPLAKLERFGLLIILGILFLLPLMGKMVGMNINSFDWLIGMPASWILTLIATFTGWENGIGID